MNFGKCDFNYEYVAARTLLMMFKLMGLAPFSVRTSSEWCQSKRETPQDSASIKLSSSTYGCVYNLGLFAVHVITIIVGFPFMDSIEYPNKSRITFTIELVECVLGNIVMSVIWLTVAFRQKTAARLFNRMFSMDGAMALLNDNQQLVSSTSFIAFLSVMNTAIWMTLGIITSLAFDLPLATYVLYILTSCILSWFVFQYTFMLKLIENRFVIVNQALRDHLAPSIPCVPYILCPSRDLVGNHSSRPKIATLKRAYTCLCDVSSEVSDFYSAPILFTIAYLTFAFLYNSYYLVLSFVAVTGRPSLTVLADSLLSIIIHILPTILLASGVTNTIRESSKTADIVWNLRAISNSSHDYNNELEQFSLELLHRKVQFSACGFFSLDRTIVHSILSMVLTYLIILIQFHMGSATDA